MTDDDLGRSLVSCPICSVSVDLKTINDHLDRGCQSLAGQGLRHQTGRWAGPLQPVGAGAIDLTLDDGAEDSTSAVIGRTHMQHRDVDTAGGQSKRARVQKGDALSFLMRSATSAPSAGLSARRARSQFRPLAVELPCCKIGDVERCQALMEQHGIVVFKGAATAQELGHGEDLFWKWIEGLGMGVRRDEPETYTNKVFQELGYLNTGVTCGASVGQSRFMWFCRQLPGVQRAQATLWNTSDLITSFDGCGIWRNPYFQSVDQCLTKGGWYHLDQNWFEKPGFHMYQGLLNFFPATTAAGSTVVLPGSHRDFRENCSRGQKPLRGPFVRMIGRGDAEYCKSRAVQALLQPGDFLAWDSRTVHCSSGIDPAAVVEEVMGNRKSASLARLVAYIAMLPRRCLGQVPERVAASRKSAVMAGTGSGHDPLQIRRGWPPAPGYIAPTLDDPLWTLV